VLALQRAAAQATITQTTRGEVRPPSGTFPAPSGEGSSTPPVSGRAGIAVQTALAQLGEPYVYGAAGPSSFDCSGLTMYSWAAAGVSLSHASSVQSGQGVPVSISELQPGDLVFYYSPVSHVAMYIGNGQVVHAPHPGSSVEIVPLNSMPISWARRVG
jgi:cell wall-associated NlpC family hydrolase